jgi:hypothetical protein
MKMREKDKNEKLINKFKKLIIKFAIWRFNVLIILLKL